VRKPDYQASLSKDFATKPVDAVYIARILETHTALSEHGIGFRMIDERVKEYRRVILQNEKDIEVRNAIMENMNFEEQLREEITRNQEERDNLGTDIADLGLKVRELKSKLAVFDATFFEGI
jgi:predicted HTH transcriptional regulator